MKKFIHKTNTYFIENHPTIWNTKLLWVASITVVLHILFFVFGIFAISNPETLHDYGAKDIFFKNGAFFIGVILSILILVTWLIYLLKNNAFKSFYPTTRFTLFKQFIIYLIIIFLSTTFCISYNMGVKSSISGANDDESLIRDITTSNAAALFFSQNALLYTLNQRSYPPPFNTLYCETYNGTKRHETRSSLQFLDFNYTFYSIYEREGKVSSGYSDSTYKGYIYRKTKDTITTYFFKDSVYDVSSLVKSPKPSYFNYSSTFYKSITDNSTDTDIEYNYANYENDNGFDYGNLNYQVNAMKANESSTKSAYELLKRNNPNEIKQLLTAFLSICDRHKIRHNLTSDTWFELVYHPEDHFELKHVIRKTPKETLEYGLTESQNAIEVFYDDRITDYHLDIDSLHNVFENIEDIKSSSFFLESIHIFMWFAFFVSACLFAFRITDLKTLIFTVITIGVLIIFISLVAVLYAYISKFNDQSTGYFISYVLLALGAVILSIPLIYSKKIKKIVVGICLNMSIIGFILYILLILFVISMHQTDACGGIFSHLNQEDCFNILNSLGITWSYILFIVNLFFMYFYARVIKKWKALPEG